MAHTRVRVVLAVVLCAALGTPALAKPVPPWKQHFEKGRTNYDLGRFDDAIAEFQKAYELKPDAAFLFNIAQSYRQKGEPKEAIFFYKRYLALKPDAPNRADVEKRIAEQEEILKQQEAAKVKPPDRVEDPKEDDNNNNNVDDPEKDKLGFQNERKGPDDEPRVHKKLEKPTTIRMGAEGGPAFMSMGEGPAVPPQFSLRIGAAYTMPAGPVKLDLGAAFTYSPIPYSLSGTGGNERANLIGLLANIAARYPLMAKLDARGEVGVGVLMFSGLVAGNPFTDGGLPASGPLGMLDLRLGLGLDYSIGGGLILTATPVALSVSPAHDGLDDRISTIVRFDVLFGLGYAL